MNGGGAMMLYVYYGGTTLLLLIPGIAVLLWLRSLIRRWVAPVPTGIDHLWAAKAARGLLLGLVLVALSVLPGVLAGAFAPGHAGWQPFAGSEEMSSPSMAGIATLFVFQAAQEELVFRAISMGLFGVLLLWLVKMLLGLRPAAKANRISAQAWLGFGFIVSAAVSVAFAMAHLHNPDVSRLALTNIALAGLLLGLVAWTDGDIWGAWALHFCWNFALAALGLPVSGIGVNTHGPFTGAVPGLLTGGGFGPEGSLPNTVALLAGCVLVLWLARRGFREETAAEVDFSVPETESPQ